MVPNLRRIDGRKPGRLTCERGDCGATEGAVPNFNVFFAHASADKARARELYRLLVPDLTVFLDEETLLPGDEWDREIPKAQRKSTMTVVLVSKAAERAFYLRDEIASAIALHRAHPEEHRLVPVFLDGKPGDAAEIPYGLNIIHAIDAVVEGGLDGVAKKLKAVAAKLEALPPAEVPEVARGFDALGLYGKLVKLAPSQFDTFLFFSGVPAEHVPPSVAPLASRALAVVQLLQQSGPKAWGKATDALQRAAPGGGGAPGMTTASPPKSAPSPAGGPAKASEPISERPDVLFSWVHLSDLHFGSGSAEHHWDRALVLQALAADVKKSIANAGVRPDALFVTGDIAFSGATRNPREYDDAKSWLRGLAVSIGLGKEHVFVVPGNHDVQWSVDARDRSVKRLMNALRSGEEPLDNVLADPQDAASLESRQANFRAFARDFGPACLTGGDGGLFWSHHLAAGRLGIRVAGLNTALLAGDEQDKGKLRLGKAQLARALKDGANEPTVVLVLTHHPFVGGWLADEKDAASWVRNHAHVHLCGHVHEADTAQVISGGGKSFVTVTAGASYGDSAKGVPASHGYSLAALVRGEDGELNISVWPRRWSEKNADFRLDVENVEEGALCTVRAIPRIRVGPPAPTPQEERPPPSARQPVARPSPLVKAWLDDTVEQLQWLPILGFQERYKIHLKLDEIFVPLGVRAGLHKQPPMRGRKEPEDSGESREVDLAGALKLIAGVPDVAGLVVLGDPGAGKTTLLKQLFMRVHREGSASVGLPEGLLPVFLRCSQIDQSDLTPRGLVSAIEREVARNKFPGAGEALASEAPLLFVLDGLDEVREEKVRVRLGDWLCEEARRWKGSRFVVSCRFAAWGRRGPLLDQRFLPVDVQMLDDASVRSYVTKWFAAVERGLDPVNRDQAEARAKESSEKLLAQLLDPKRQSQFRLREMTQNPLLLSTLCLVHHSEWKLPDRRGDLYDRCISLLLETWAARRDGRPTLPDKAARLVLQPLAWAMHSAEAREWPADKVEATIKGPLSELPDLPKSPSEFLERARSDCGVLASKDAGHYEFFHLSFQEYLAAVHAKEQGKVKELAENAGKPWWREVVLLAAAQPAVLGELVRTLAATTGLEPHRELLRECATEAVQLKADPFLEVIEQGLKGEWGGLASVTAVLDALGSRAPEAVVERARGLSHAVDEVIRAMALRMVGERESPPPTASLTPGQPFREKTTKMSFLWVPPGKFWMGSSKKPEDPTFDPEALDRELPAREVTLSQGFWIGEFPVTNAQYALFLEATGAKEPEFWRNKGFNDPEQPLVGVDWEESRAFNLWLTEQARLGVVLRFDLPTEAEWEYVARGGQPRKYPWGYDALTQERADYAQGAKSIKPARVGTHPTGRGRWGTQDMVGCVWEWCLDGWQDNFVNMTTQAVDPCQPTERAARRVVRGGAWWNDDRGFLRCVSRDGIHPGYRDSSLGFRVVCRGSRQHIDP